jgi:putative thiamine transport system permease protein
MTPSRALIPSALLLCAGVPLLATTWLALGAVLDPSAWTALWADPAWLPALGLSLWTGLASTALAWWISAALLARAFVQHTLARLLRGLPVMLATPHAAFAIGLVFLVSPSGWLLRALSPWLTGFAWPPGWPTTQDPWGLGLIVALVAKEVPFLLWTAATQLQRDDVRTRWRREHALAQTLGYSPPRAWWRVVWPQLSHRLRWPLVAVLAYGLTVVDMALIIGPAAPPTLAVLAWQWLQDADALRNAQGAAAGGLLAVAVLLSALGWLALLGRASRRVHWTNGERGTASGLSTPPHDHPGLGTADAPAAPETARTDSRGLARWTPPRQTAWRPAGAGGLMALYAAVLLALAVGSVAGRWPFPLLWPETLTTQAWASVAASSATATTTLWLGLAASAGALAWSLAWLEFAPRAWDRAIRPVLFLPLVLPAVLWVVGLYGVALRWRLEGQWSGLLLAHTLMVLPYVWLSLSPAYRGFDARLHAVSATLGHGRGAFLWRVKWPLLRRSISASAAVGFAVSVAQYLPTLYVGAGRHATVTTEAVTLAAGAQRSLTSAFAALQFALPVLAFALAAWIGRPRRFTPTDTPHEPCA